MEEGDILGEEELQQYGSPVGNVWVLLLDISADIKDVWALRYVDFFNFSLTNYLSHLCF